jgi:hypothetical protein
MKKYLFVAIVLVLFAFDAEAQCSMCSAVVESSQKSGSQLAEGLNSGILYLMGIPYALLIGMGILLFRRLNQNNSES